MSDFLDDSSSALLPASRMAGRPDRVRMQPQSSALARPPMFSMKIKSKITGAPVMPVQNHQRTQPIEIIPKDEYRIPARSPRKPSQYITRRRPIPNSADSDLGDGTLIAETIGDENSSRLNLVRVQPASCKIRRDKPAGKESAEDILRAHNQQISAARKALASSASLRSKQQQQPPLGTRISACPKPPPEKPLWAKRPSSGSSLMMKDEIMSLLQSHNQAVRRK